MAKHAAKFRQPFGSHCPLPNRAHKLQEVMQASQLELERASFVSPSQAQLLRVMPELLSGLLEIWAFP